MLGTREVPWAGLGINISDTTTIEDALRKANLDWQVKQEQIVHKDQKTGYFLNVRDADDKVLGVVGGRYQPVQNVEAFKFVEELLGEGVSFEMVGSTPNGKRVWLLAKMPDMKILGEPVDPYICLSNSHDGCGSLKVFMTPIRIACQNMINIALNKSNRYWSVRHTGSISSKLHEAERTLGLAQDYMSGLSREAEELSMIKVAPKQFELLSSKLFPITEEMGVRKENSQIMAREQLNAAWQMDDLGSIRGTGWGFINAVSDMATHKPVRNTEDAKVNAFMYHLDEPNILLRAHKLLKEAI